MDGEEASLFVLTDGEVAVLLPSAQDHKRAFDSDAGPNTGGMGAYSPAPVVTDQIAQAAMDQIVLPTIREMARRGTPYSGVLYVGLMIGPDGPRLVEYNARFGDPECQVLMMRLQSDIVPALMGCASGALGDCQLAWSDDPALTVVMAADGYPGGYAKGEPIGGLDRANAVQDVVVFHAGTRHAGETVVSNGGRVLNVTAHGQSVGEARDRAYRAVDQIDWPGGFCRRDIAWRALARRGA